jgi:hypothetical protein
MPRVSATIEDGIFERMEKYRGQINFSKVFKEAVPDIVADAIREVEKAKAEGKKEARILRLAMETLPDALLCRVLLKVDGNGLVSDQEFDFRPPREK